MNQLVTYNVDPWHSTTDVASDLESVENFITCRRCIHSSLEPNSWSSKDQHQRPLLKTKGFSGLRASDFGLCTLTFDWPGTLFAANVADGIMGFAVGAPSTSGGFTDRGSSRRYFTGRLYAVRPVCIALLSPMAFRPTYMSVCGVEESRRRAG